MYLKKREIAKTSLLHRDKYRIWTPDAVGCLKRHFRCGTCPIFEVLGDDCKMKQTVLNIIKIFGQPDEYTEPTIREE